MLALPIRHQRDEVACGSRGVWLQLKQVTESPKYRRGGGLVRNPMVAMSIKASLGSFALITCLGLWKWLEMGLSPRITCTARSCPSLWRKISD